jgi:hypothetical protein
MTTTCSHRHLHEHTQAPTGRWLKRLTRVCGPARSAPSPSRYAAGTDRASGWPPPMTRPQRPSGSIERAAREAPLLETPRLDLLLRSRAA